MLETTAELCKRLHVCDETIYRMIESGRIPMELTAKVGNQWRFNGERIEAHLMNAPAKKTGALKQ